MIFETRYYLVLLGLICTSFAPKQKIVQTFQINGYTQGTTYAVKYYASKALVSEEEIEVVLAQLNQSLSVYHDKSLISQFNLSKRGILLDKHLGKVVKAAQKVAKASAGAFDITVYPLVEAWGFLGKEKQLLPDSLAIEKILNNVGYQQLIIKKDSLMKINPAVKIDVNGIAQGYSVDVLADFLERKGIHHYIVEIGGELRIKGKKPDGSYPKIGIEAPSLEETSLQQIIIPKKGAITTSGSYRKFIESKGLKQTHLIDAKKGYPIKSKNISVTVYAKTAMLADAYDNVLMGMDIEEAFRFSKKHPNLEAFFIYQENGILKDTATIGFSKLIAP
ncbi:thiamine biosynthesis lipoprotein ApbE [Pedobacter glucosidilyticus]|nr:FAD:protein FMN transferase [Pedobacter glucosidilyticus]KHJ39362.1 thiamine biosynthesis lipoprotein ApbE [Pedobacter glucosidilyticus]